MSITISLGVVGFSVVDGSVVVVVDGVVVVVVWGFVTRGASIGCESFCVPGIATIATIAATMHTARAI
ncbi:MAG: hypothetical protein IKY44_06645 [Clostridia bacterium]|nr:hypothetical protein [Clostridia bacterium]